MTKLRKEFDHFNDYIKITSEANDLREKRSILEEDFKENFPKICTENDILLSKTDMRFIDQGSYKLNTTISNSNGGVDRDVATIFPLDIYKYNDPRILKKYARDAMKIENIRIPIIKEPCITISYCKQKDEYLHIDFPIYAQCNGRLYLARGKENSEEYKWEEADPEGLNYFFLEKLKISEQLRRIIRYLKKWKQVKYQNTTNRNEIPPNIALTLLACEHFEEKMDGTDYNDLAALNLIVTKILEKFMLTYNGSEVIRAQLQYNLPKVPYTDVLYKMNSNDSYGLRFYNKLKKASENLVNACNVESDHEAALYVQKVLGDEFEVPEKVAVTTSTANRKEHSFG